MARGRDDAGGETALMAAAMEEALGVCGSASGDGRTRGGPERLSDEIIASLTSGLLVVGDDHRVKSLNPAGRRLLDARQELTGDIATLLTAPTLARAVEECRRAGSRRRRPSASRQKRAARRIRRHGVADRH